MVFENMGLIAAIGENRELGYKNDLVWRIKEDLKWFRENTMGCFCILGRRTYESMPKKLPGRRYVIVCNDGPVEHDDSAVLMESVDEVLEFVRSRPDERFMVIGGGTIYSLFLPYVSQMYLTEIEASGEADVFFPEFDAGDWVRSAGEVLEDGGVRYRHVLYRRKGL